MSCYSLWSDTVPSLFIHPNSFIIPREKPISLIPISISVTKNFGGVIYFFSSDGNVSNVYLILGPEAPEVELVLEIVYLALFIVVWLDLIEDSLNKYLRT